MQPRLAARRLSALVWGAAVTAAGAAFLAQPGHAILVPDCPVGQITKTADPSLSAPSPTNPGATITSSAGSWSSCGDPLTGSYREWLRDGVVFSGPTWVSGSPGPFSYVVQSGDVGHAIRSAVTVCNVDGCSAYAQS
jgi:hypothetical protein